jgi:hypothetical protein
VHSSVRQADKPTRSSKRTLLCSKRRRSRSQSRKSRSLRLGLNEKEQCGVSAVQERNFMAESCRNSPESTLDLQMPVHEALVLAYPRVVVHREQPHARVVGADQKVLAFWVELDACDFASFSHRPAAVSALDLRVVVHLLVRVDLIKDALAVQQADDGACAAGVEAGRRDHHWRLDVGNHAAVRDVPHAGLVVEAPG